MVDRGIQGLGVVEFSVSYWPVTYLAYESYWIILNCIIIQALVATCSNFLSFSCSPDNQNEAPVNLRFGWVPTLGDTKGTINMEPEYTPLEKENIFQTNILRFYVNLQWFRGVHQCAVVYKGHCAEWKNETSKLPDHRMKEKPMWSWVVKKVILNSRSTFQIFIPPLLKIHICVSILSYSDMIRGFLREVFQC